MLEAPNLKSCLSFQGHSDTVAVTYSCVWRSGITGPSFYCSWFCGLGIQAGLSGTACLCCMWCGWTCSCSCTQLLAGLGWRTQEGLMLNVYWVTLVLLLSASPQRTSIWFLILQGFCPHLLSLALQQDSLAFFRIGRVEGEIIKSLKVWVWKSQNMPSTAFTWSQRIPRSAQTKEVRKQIPSFDGRDRKHGQT